MNEVRLLSWLRHQKGLVLQYQLHNRIDNLTDVSTRCSGLLSGLLVFFALKKTRASGQNIGKVFNPVVKLVLENQPFLNGRYVLLARNCQLCTGTSQGPSNYQLKKFTEML